MDVMQSEFWAQLAIIGGMILACSTVLAYLQPAISQVLSRFFGLTFTPMHAVQKESYAYIRKSLAWSGRQFRSEEGGNAWWRVLGAIIGALFFALCFICDLGIVMMTLEAYGLGSTQVTLPGDPIWAIGAALLSSGAVWGILLTDLMGVTKFWPWTEKFEGQSRRIMMIFTGLMIFLVVSVIACMAVWRSGSMTEAMDMNQQLSVQAAESGQLTLGADAAQPLTEAPQAEVNLKSEVKETGNDAWMIYYPNVGIAVSSFLGAAICINSFLAFLKYLGLTLVALCCLIIGIPVALLWVMLKLNDAFYWLAEAILNLLAMPGRGLLRLLGMRRVQQQQAQPAQAPQVNGAPTQMQVAIAPSQAAAIPENNRQDSQESNDAGKIIQAQREKDSKENMQAAQNAGHEASADAQESEPELHKPQAVNYDPFRA
jgi:hypothetical protein